MGPPAPLAAPLRPWSANVPVFGSNGLVMVVGGHELPVDSEIDLWHSAPVSMGDLTFFDPYTREEY